MFLYAFLVIVSHLTEIQFFMLIFLIVSYLMINDIHLQMF